MHTISTGISKHSWQDSDYNDLTLIVCEARHVSIVLHVLGPICVDPLGTVVSKRRQPYLRTPTNGQVGCPTARANHSCGNPSSVVRVATLHLPRSSKRSAHTHENNLPLCKTDMTARSRVLPTGVRGLCARLCQQETLLHICSSAPRRDPC
jgi:hypothetical protein